MLCPISIKIKRYPKSITFETKYLLLPLYYIEIDLSRNRLAKVTNGAFNNLTNLTHLDLSYNKLVRLDTVSVEPLKSLQFLNISGNMQMDLIDIRDTFQVSSNII